MGQERLLPLTLMHIHMEYTEDLRRGFNIVQAYWRTITVFGVHWRVKKVLHFRSSFINAASANR